MSENDWRDASAYAYVSELSLAGLAWEFLRRNAAYRAAFDAGPDTAAVTRDWGLSAPANPAGSAEGQAVLWRPDVSPRTLALVASSADLNDVLVFEPQSWPGVTRQHTCADGVHILVRIRAEEHRLWSAQAPYIGQPLVIALPLDAHLAVRTEAAARLMDSLMGRKPKAVKRFSRGFLRRLVLALRALDGRAAGASQREIAEGVLNARYGSPRVWEDSAARAMTARLLRFGAAMASGGYRSLLASRKST
ncbi:MAG: DNA -binding domain-containing protein [Caulobacteraceae bacterium]